MIRVFLLKKKPYITGAQHVNDIFGNLYQETDCLDIVDYLHAR